MPKIVNHIISNIKFIPITTVWIYSIAAFSVFVYNAIFGFTDNEPDIKYSQEFPQQKEEIQDNLSIEQNCTVEVSSPDYDQRICNNNVRSKPHDVGVDQTEINLESQNSVNFTQNNNDGDAYFLPCTAEYGCIKTTISDKNGHTSDVIFDRIGQSYYWSYGSYESIMVTSRDTLRVDQIFNDRYTKSRLRHAEEIIALGMASSNGNNKHQETLSEDRARKLVMSLKNTADSESINNIYIMNIGRYTEEKDNDRQRIPLIVIVLKKTGEIDMVNAIHRYLVETPIHGIKIDGFSIIKKCLLKNKNSIDTSCLSLVPMN